MWMKIVTIVGLEHMAVCLIDTFENHSYTTRPYLGPNKAIVR